MTSRQQTYALLGVLFGAVCGWFFFRDNSGNVLSTVLPAAILAIAFGFVGYYLARDSSRSRP
ncbi:MAG TPA: hypothetical protein VFR07_18945 [Mycobacteriales bacterium]|jgi:sulfite exporter TauE/SafE|nr:hypothetical protein [Mycobacteriales bacterium]